MTEIAEGKSSSLSPTGFPINWSLITGPVPEPVFTTPPLSNPFSLSQNSAVHSLQTKVKTFTQRRLRGREKDKERIDHEVQDGSSSGIASEVLLRPKQRGKNQISITVPSWRSGAARNLSTSDEDQEVEVQVKLEIHSPPAEAQGEMVFQGTQEANEDASENSKSQVSLIEGKSLESVLPGSSSSGKDEASRPLQATTIASTTSSSSTRHWAPPKGFWKVARPETLLLNGVSPSSVPSTLPTMDYTKTEANLKWKKAAETVNESDVGVAVDDADAPSGMKHSDSMECYLDRCEQKEVEAKGLCSSDSCESTTSQSDGLSTDDKLRAKERAYAKLRERQQICREERGQNVQSAGQYEDTSDWKGRALVQY